MPPPLTTLCSLMQTPRPPGDLGVSRRHALKRGGGNVRGLPVSPVPPHFFLSLPIPSRSFPTSRDVFQPRAILRRPSQTIATIADHRRRPHSLAQPRTASPGLSQRPSKYGRLGTIHGHLYIHTSR